MALSGQASRLAARLRRPASPATRLRPVRVAPVPSTPTLQAIDLTAQPGVDATVAALNATATIKGHCVGPTSQVR